MDCSLVHSERAPVGRAPVAFGEFQYQKFEKGRAIPEHFHAHPYLSFVGAGAYLEKSGTAEHFCRKNQIIFHPENESHKNIFPDDSSVYSLFLNAALEEGVRREIKPLSRGVFMFPGLQMVFGKIAREFQLRDSFSPLVMEGLGYEILGEFLRAARAGEKPGSQAIAEKAFEIIMENPEKPLTLGDIAEELGVEPSTVARSFKKMTGVTVGEFQRQKRVEAAKALLAKSSLPLSQVALEAGFYDQAHMCRIFLKFTGFSPLKFREKFNS